MQLVGDATAISIVVDRISISCQDDFVLTLFSFVYQVMGE